ANRDLSLDCIPLSVHQNSGDGRSPIAWLFPHLIDDLEGDAADPFRRLAGDEPFDPRFPEGEPFVGAGRRPRTHRQLRFELSDSRREVRHIHAPRGSQRNCLAASAALSSSATRASMSSISIALAAWLKIASAARTRTDAGVAGSIMVFSKVVAAAEVPCWSRATACPKAARRASR